jgi:rhomboid protease GluP
MAPRQGTAPRDAAALAPSEQPLRITADMLAGPQSGGVYERRRDFESGMSYAPPATLLLLVSLVIAFMAELGDGSLTTAGAGLVGEYALVRDEVLAGAWWRMLTAAFLHGSPSHLIGNGVSLYILGMACEHALGTRRMVAAYLVAALGGSVLSMALYPGPSVGASGAIFGLMGAIVILLRRQREVLYVRDGRIGVVVAAWAGYTFLLGAMNPMIDNGAHLGGFVAGALVAMVLRPRVVR